MPGLVTTGGLRVPVTQFPLLSMRPAHFGGVLPGSVGFLPGSVGFGVFWHLPLSPRNWFGPQPPVFGVGHRPSTRVAPPGQSLVSTGQPGLPGLHLTLVAPHVPAVIDSRVQHVPFTSNCGNAHVVTIPGGGPHLPAL